MEAALAAAIAAIIEIFGASMVQHGVTFAINAFDKIGFDMDVIGRRRKIQEVSQTSMMEYTKRGQCVNIMVWNMHVPNDHNLTAGLLQQFTVKMGDGGGFCVEIFTGGGDFINHGDLEPGNWRGEGNSEIVYNERSRRMDHMRFRAAR